MLSETNSSPSRARESFSAKENFLTEGFAYFLQRNNKVCAAFVKKVLGYPVEIKPGYNVDTRSAEPTATGNCFPDLKLTFSFRRSIGVPRELRRRV
jgi:hypothetical protein